MHATAQRMGDALVTRGPDDAGVWVDAASGIALAHRRLSIIDLSPEGHQPMISASGRYVISYNGEIYNYRELRARLDYPWRGGSDTEVLLAAVEAWGVEKALQTMNGMFAFALWDMHEKVLYLARDRMGEKPLYYGWVDGNFVFASELKALRTLPQWAPSIHREALGLFMRYSYVPAPLSIYESIAKLPAGCLLRMSQAQPVVTPYWRLADTIATRHANAFIGSAEEAVTALDAQLQHSIAQRMMADVPLGAFLSGGIDSSLIVALMQAQSSRPIQTFTIGFREQGFDEAPYAKAVAQHLHTEHHELYLSPREAAAVIPQLPTMYDEPFADASQIPTYLVAKFARQHVTVALSGDGGDEVFGGYNRYMHAPRLWNMLRLLPTPMRRTVAALLRHAPLPSRMQFLSERMDAASDKEFYRALCSVFTRPQSLVQGGGDGLISFHDTPNLPFAEWMMAQDALTYFPDDILVKVDRAAMAVSLETRTPFTDPDLIALAWRLPLAMKIHTGKGKWLLRQVLYRYVPQQLIERPKAGFAVPIASWLRGDLRNWAEDLLAPQTIAAQGYFDPASVQHLWKMHQSGRRDCSKPLWNVLMFQSWLATQ